MIKALSNGESQKWSHDCLLRFFFIFLTPKLITCFIQQFHFKNASPINYLFTKWEWTYILDFGPWNWSALNMGFVNTMTFNNRRTTFFWSRVGRDASSAEDMIFKASKPLFRTLGWQHFLLRCVVGTRW